MEKEIEFCKSAFSPTLTPVDLGPDALPSSRRRRQRMLP
jgi:hypothetical protein